MIRRLRWKFVLAFTSVASLFLTALLAGLYLSSAAHYRQASLETLRSVLLERGRPRGGAPVALAEESPPGQLRVVLNHIYPLTEEEIAQAAAEAGRMGTDSGDLPAQHLRFLRQGAGPGRTRYAFADTTGELASLRTQALHSLLIGAAALAGLLAFSLLLSKWMIRPIEEAWTRQRQFVADASHELKTPLTVALSNVDMALAAPALPPNGKGRRRLDITKAELLRMKGLVEKLLALARMDAKEGRPPASPLAPVDLSYLLACSAASFEPLFFEAGRQLASAIAPGCHTRGDAGQLSQLAGILLDNACKYSAPGSTAFLRLERAKGGRLLLSIEDQGAPIPPEDLPRIFQRFYRADPSRGETPGYGLGLSIAHEIAAQHKGKIWAKSAGGRTVFYVELPCAPPAQNKR